jgi:hypothetical protein
MSCCPAVQGDAIETQRAERGVDGRNIRRLVATQASLDPRERRTPSRRAGGQTGFRSSAELVWDHIGDSACHIPLVDTW